MRHAEKTYIKSLYVSNKKCHLKTSNYPLTTTLRLARLITTKSKYCRVLTIFCVTINTSTKLRLQVVDYLAEKTMHCLSERDLTDLYLQKKRLVVLPFNWDVLCILLCYYHNCCFSINITFMIIIIISGGVGNNRRISIY